MKNKFLTILLLAASVAMGYDLGIPGTVYKDTVFVDNTVTGGNGTDSANAFDALSDAATFFNGKNLTTGADSGKWLVSVSGPGKANVVTFSGCTTSTTCYIDVVVHPLWRPDSGKYDVNKYRIWPSYNTSPVVLSEHVHLYYLQILG